MDLKQAIQRHFGDDYTRFFRHFHPDLPHGDKPKVAVLCSTHNDHAPSRNLVLRGKKAGTHYCQVCNGGGDAFSYYAMKKGLSCESEFSQVLWGIIIDFSIVVPTNGRVKQNVVATFDYTDKAGNVVYQIQRKAPGKKAKKKDFVFRRPDGKGGWIYNSKDVDLVPYRLHGLLESKGKGPVVVVEGEGKADLLWKMGIRATTNPFGAGKWDDSYAPHLADEVVILWPDKDDGGYRHMERVATSLKPHARSIGIVTPPAELPAKGDVINGVNELGWQGEDLDRIVAAAKAWEPGEAPVSDNAEQGKDDSLYEVRGGCIGHMKKVKDVEMWVALCNFAAKVIEQRIIDNGVEESRRLVIELTLCDGRTFTRVEIPVCQFEAMTWVVRECGVEARLNAGMGSKDHVRAAIQAFSTDVASVYSYTHTGWRRIDGKWQYLHAGRTDFQVDLGSALSRYALPESAHAVPVAVRHSLDLLEIAPYEVTVPLLAVVFLAPLCEFLHPDFVVFLVGKTGRFKSTIAALFLSHFGLFTRTDLPGSWESTDNALESLLFQLKDVLCVVDDYAPRADRTAQQKQAQKAQRIIRSMGNLAGRGRLTGDLTRRPDYPPRGLMVSTGEDLPPGQSVLARTLSIEMSQDVDLKRLTAAQQTAKKLPHAMAGYIDWLAPQLETLPSELQSKWENHRARFTQEGTHLRIPEILAYLSLGVDLFTTYAQEAGVLDEAAVTSLTDEADAALLALGAAHSRRITEEDPAEVYLGTLSVMLQQGRVQLADRNAQVGVESDGLIGWRDSKPGYAYLIPLAAQHAVAKYLQESGNHFPHSQRALNEALKARGALVLAKDGKSNPAVKLGGRTRRVLQIPLGLLEPNESVTP